MPFAPNFLYSIMLCAVLINLQDSKFPKESSINFDARTHLMVTGSIPAVVIENIEGRLGRSSCLANWAQTQPITLFS
jgi:hypothetical protein